MAGKITGKYNLDDFKGAGHASCLECQKDMASKDPVMEKMPKLASMIIEHSGGRILSENIKKFLVVTDAGR